MATAHFQGTEKVLRAYQFNKVGAWAIFSGRDILFQSPDPDLEVSGSLLEEVLNEMIDGGSTGTFQLKMYCNLPKDGFFTNATPWNYSFRFRLLSEDEFDRGGNARTNPILARLSAIEAKLQDEPEEEPEEENTFQAAIGRMINRPDVQNMLLQKLMGLIGTLFGPKTTPASMAGVPNNGTMTDQPKTAAELFAALDPTQQLLFDQAVQILLSGDPAIGTNLMKLANILKNDKARYTSLCSMV